MRVLLVDDHGLFREGLRLMLAGLSNDIEFFIATTCEEAIELDSDPVKLILLDLGLPGKSSHEALAAMRERYPDSTIVIVSGEEEPAVIRHTISNGAAGYIPKSSAPEVLLPALQLILAGGTYLPPHVLDGVAANGANDNHVIDMVKQLSARQLDVLNGAVHGKLNKVIASELNIAEGTVKAHLSAAFRALGAKNRTEAVYLVTRYNLNLSTINPG